MQKAQEELNKRKEAQRVKEELQAILQQKFLQFYDFCTDGNIKEALYFFENPLEADNEVDKSQNSNELVENLWKNYDIDASNTLDMTEAFKLVQELFKDMDE